MILRALQRIKRLLKTNNNSKNNNLTLQQKQFESNGYDISNIGCIICNSEQIIEYVNTHLLIMLKYEKKDLLGKHISIIMSKNIADMHVPIFKKLKESSNVKKYTNNCMFKRKIKNIIYDSENEPNIVFLELFVYKDTTSKLLFEFVNKSNTSQHINKFQTILDNTCYVQYLDCERHNSTIIRNQLSKYESFFESRNSTCVVTTYDSVICIMLDVANSTMYSNNHTSSTMALLYFKIYKNVTDIIIENYYPYAYIHETCGDSIFILMNGSFMVRNNEICCTLALNMVHNIMKKLNNMFDEINENLYIRCGISLGEIAAGVIDNSSFRVFGKTVHLASRLETISSKDSINVCENFYQKLKKENETYALSFYEQNMEIKGLGMVMFYKTSAHHPFVLNNE